MNNVNPVSLISLSTKVRTEGWLFSLRARKQTFAFGSLRALADCLSSMILLIGSMVQFITKIKILISTNTQADIYAVFGQSHLLAGNLNDLLPSWALLALSVTIISVVSNTICASINSCHS